MPSRWDLALAGPAEAGIPLAAPHAVVSGWLDDRSTGPRESRAGRSEHGDQVKKWAFGPLRAFSGGGEGIVMQVRLLDDALEDRLLAGTALGTAVRLGAHQYRVREPAHLVERSAWANLRLPPGSLGSRAWQVRFVSPACLRRRNRAAPLLSPDALALGLAERWRLLDPLTAPALPWRPGAGPVWVSDLDGHTEVQILPRTVRLDGRQERRQEIISGFVGRVRYVCDHGSDAEATAFGELLAFAAFAGAGSHTAYGFGVLIPEPTWQPPTARTGSQ
jgi:CRISPR-associated endoribonuclease Cas6